MKVLQVSFNEVEQFAPTDVAFAQMDKNLLQFAHYTPELSSFEQAIEDKKRDVIDRSLLVDVLTKQYEAYTTPGQAAMRQIGLLAHENTFTIVTAHQPVLFTGPAFVAYKILSVVKLTRLLREAYAGYHFVPVFLVGGEDHDFEEMDHTSLYGKTIRWDNDESGSVGRMSTESLKPALAALKEILGTSPAADEMVQLFEKTHTHHQTYGPAFADLINGLFGHLGVVVINMDEPRFKARMINIFQDELLHHHAAAYVRTTQKSLEDAGFGAQTYARDINLFYLDKGIRNRIEKTGDRYQVVDTDLQFTRDEILRQLNEHPERFSPNVIIRPLFQEMILPNLAYVGGGGELAYWLERKQQFDYFGINFPVLVRRDSVLWIDRGTVKKMQKLSLDVPDFFQSEVSQIKEYVAQHAEHEFSLEEEKKALEKLWLLIEDKAGVIDPTLKAAAAAEGKNQIKSLEKIEDRLRRAEKQKHEIAISQIKNIREKIYPGGGLQERVANYLEFYLRYPDNYYELLLEHLNPLDMQLKIFIDEE